MNAFEIASLSMGVDMQRLSDIGQNLANVQTAGYKRAIVAQRPFVDALAAMAPQAGADTALDMSAGPLRASPSALDLAIDGDGFFEFETSQGPALSRQAVLHVDAQGRLVNDAGLPIRSERGQLHVGASTSELRVDARGEVWDGERSLGRLQVSRVAEPAALASLGGGLYRAQPNDVVQATDTAHVLAGQREGSNVSSSAEMVRLMETSRHFEAMAKVVQGYDEAMDKAIRKLGDLGA